MSTGRVIADRFDIKDLEKELLGRGGMGEVFRATDLLTGELVAVKLLNPDVVARDPALLERFVREGEALRQLNHPNIVRMVAAVEEQEATTGVVAHYLVIEYVAGGSLRDLLSVEGRLPAQRVMEIGLDLADALTRAHRLGILHRDLKPENVLLAEDGTPRLADFGLAHVIASPRLTQSGLLMGTVDYVSPEACRGEPLDERCDIWSFGVMLYEMLCGQLPFGGDTLPAKLTAILGQPVPDLLGLVPGTPAALADLVHRMLEKDRHRRIPSVRLVGADLEAILRGWEIPAQESPADSGETRVAQTTPPAAAAKQGQPAHNLPTQLTSFIGREREMEDVKHLLVTTRLLTLTGAGGTGKTRLSLQVATDLLHDFEDGVFFVGLASIRDPTLVLPAIAGALDARQMGGRPLLEQLKDYLRDKHMLLVLDNFEQLMDAAPQVGELLATAPRLKVLVTSRELLRVYGEYSYPVPPLATPDLQSPPSIAQLTQVEAVQLFLQRARAVRPDFALTRENVRAVAEICAKLDGLPLALEMAAARVRLLPARKLLAQLDSRLHFLTGGARDLPARQRTLRATMDWSYDLLDADQKTLFRRLAVFVGGCTLEAVAAVGSDSGELDILGRLEGLVDKSLLQLSEVDGEPRYGMLETIHEYALERLTGSGEAATMRQRHACFFLALAEDAESQLYGPEHAAWLSRLEVEQDNLRAALAWSLDSAKETGLRIAGALGPFWRMRVYHDEGRDWLTKALAGSEGCGPEVDHLRAKALSEAGSVAGFQGDWTAAHALQQESVTLWRKVGDERGLASALHRLGSAEYNLGQPTKGRSLLQESIALFRQIGDKAGLAKALFWDGHMAWVEHDVERARSSAEESINLAQQIGSITLVAAPTSTLGRIAYDQGDYAAAQSFFKKSLALMRETKDIQGVAIVLDSLGDVSYVQGDYEQARVYWEESLEAWRKMGDKRVVAWTLHGLGYVFLRQNCWQEAQPLFAESLALHREFENRRGIALCLAGLAGVSEAQGRSERAAMLLGAADRIGEADAAFLTFFRADYDRILAAIRGQLDEEAFGAAWAEGGVRDLEATVAELLAELGGIADVGRSTAVRP